MSGPAGHLVPFESAAWMHGPVPGFEHALAMTPVEVCALLMSMCACVCVVYL